MMRVLIIVLLLLFAMNAGAHSTSTSYLQLDARSASLTGQWQVSLHDLQLLIGLDHNADGSVTWEELQAAQGSVFALLTESVRLNQTEGYCQLQPNRLLVNSRDGMQLAVVEFSSDCIGQQSFELGYTFMFADDALHKNLLTVTGSTGDTTRILDASRRIYRYISEKPSFWASFVEFTQLGVWHVLIGADHVLFVVCLVLSVSFIRNVSGTPSIRRKAKSLFTLITAFTIAHSITLALAAAKVVILPAEWVEPAIAASVVLAALTNLTPRLAIHGWRLAFAFGLLHGLGFANVMADLPIHTGGLVASLLGFNLGIELGQLMVVVLTLALLLLLGRQQQLQRTVTVAASVCIAVLGLAWVVERSVYLVS